MLEPRFLLPAGQRGGNGMEEIAPGIKILGFEIRNFNVSSKNEYIFYGN